VTTTVGLGRSKRHAQQLKQLGYRRHPHGDGWVRPVKRSWYPRFHLYERVDWGKRTITIDLHLDHAREDPDDWKRTASSDGPEVAAEMARIIAAFTG